MTDQNNAASADEVATAFLVFANDIDVRHRDSYEMWHSGHHVPQRLRVPGILGATRYRALESGSPEYLTLYRLADIGVLASPAYRALVDRPDRTTLAMRPSIFNPLRIPCRTVEGRNEIHQDYLSVGLISEESNPAMIDTVVAFLESTSLPFLIGRADIEAGGHPVFQQPLGPSSICILVADERRELLDQITTAVANRWSTMALPLMKRIT